MVDHDRLTMPLMRVASLRLQLIGFALMVTLGAGCAATVKKHGSAPAAADFFPLAPNSHWEYLVSRLPHGEHFRFAATVRPDEFAAPNGHRCRIVEERYGDLAPDERFPIVYCAEGGFLHRVMSLEYRGESLEDNGLRSGEVKFLPMNLGQASTWEGLTNAYRLPDGSGFEVRQLHKVSAQPEPVEVPAGRFERCARVETTAVHTAIGPDGSPVGPRIVYYYSDWYAPGVGLIRTEQRSATAEVLATIELVSYQIGRETPLQ
jgi:hypothetical protein